MSNVLISIASEFSKTGFNQADKSLGALGKKVTKLAAGYLSVQKAQQAMFSYIADEKGTKILAQNLKNLGLGFATQSAEEFISVLQKQTGVLDDELRPAYAQLARVTGSTLKTQQLMALAFDVSSGTGTDYAQVIDALSQAYVGNSKGLKSLNLGLTQAQLKGKSFEEIVTLLNKQFSGAGAASLDSYAGKMALLKVATSNASEAIGKGLLDAVSNASGSGGFPAFIKLIENAANKIVDLATGTSRLIEILKMIGSSTKGKGSWFEQYAKMRKRWDAEDLQIMRERAGIANNTSSYMEKQAKDSVTAKLAAQAQAKADAARLALLKKQTAEKRNQTAIDKANALIAKAKEQFDLEGIQLTAALANQTLTIEERKRLEVKQAIWELEQALAQNDQARIASATALLEKLLGQFKILQEQLMTLNEMYKVLGELGVNRQLIDLLNLEDAINLMNQMAILGQLTLPKNFPAPTATMVTKQEAAAALASALSPESMAWTTHEQAITANRSSFLNQPTMATSTQPPVVVNITDNATKIVDIAVEGLQNYDASGISTRVIRNTGGLSW